MNANIFSVFFRHTRTRVPKIGRCQPYTQKICKEYLDKKNIFVETGQIESNIEKKLEIALATMKKSQISSKCQPFVLPVMCYHLFPFCEANSNNQPKPQRICRQDCKRVQHEFCPREHQIAEDQKLMTAPMLFPNCNTLSKMKCTSLRKLFFGNITGKEALNIDNSPLLCSVRYLRRRSYLIKMFIVLSVAM